MKKLLILLLLSMTLMADDRPNVLFIAVDDLNHWVGHLGRNPQARTPNIDRLAAMGVSFRSAYCIAPACEPTRLALMSGRRPWTTGCYLNKDGWRNFQTPGDGLPAQFLQSGYYVAGAGKIYHALCEYIPKEWSEFMPKNDLSARGPGVSRYDIWPPNNYNIKDEDLADWHSVTYIEERLKKKHDKPFFLACGLFKPHLPFVVPSKYYEPFPLEDIQLPHYLEDDLDDIPEAGKAMAKIHQHNQMVQDNNWKRAIQSYLATCAYADVNVGRLLDALESGPNKENTIIVLWSDHGWSFGEKNHWRKFALWEEPTRTVFIWSAPGVTPQNKMCDHPVDHSSIYPTLCELAGIPKPAHLDGKSILPLLKDPKAEWDLPAITTHGYKNHAVRLDNWRFIQYADGSQELYDHREDPYEFTNLAKNPEYANIINKLRAHLPVEQVPHKVRAGKKKKKG